MEDRYLFKAKDCNSIWRVGLLIALQKGRCAIEEKDGSKWACDSETLCQCTTMPDKNKKLAFEHDIVWDSDERAFYEIIWNQEDMCWNVEDASGHKSEFEKCYGSTIEVKGNRFDNPELLESEG